jgi:hypothetical protein
MLVGSYMGGLLLVLFKSEGPYAYGRDLTLYSYTLKWEDFSLS